ncbi:MAG: hypothetical protein DHS20C09_19810 [marine bacterium B5-7]|nr:MAG: hypothetical protein DHS20C09_19810 [marine bacterium B5-7]
MEKTKTVKDNRLVTILATVLLALMLISQLSQASDYSKAPFLIDSNYSDSLGADDLKANNVNKYTPDLLCASSEHKQNIVYSFSGHGQVVAYIKKQIHYYSIRSPPLFS